ncbi:MAG: thioredoxin fold domain-containing protein, partial [Gammaproteobacteria bacterium]|nr:thioredoxin fold domain-containing protein [Gammaproteobacteria bacterium]
NDEPIVKETKIHWFDGSVEAGFELARSENKPVYLYWGAVWCPPCQEIKHTVFKSKRFIAQTELFVPIYLDGDTDRAQAFGEKFGVKGYPTMIIFNPEGEEVTRIPGGIDISRYNIVLELSLNQMRPTSMLVDLALHNPELLQPSDFVQLAYYSWGQDAGSLPEGTPVTFFSDLSDISSDKEASARLYMEYLVALVREQESSETESTDSNQSTGAFERVSAILDSPKLTLACWDSLGYYAEEITGLPVFSDDELAELKDKWQTQFLTLRHQPSLSTAEQLTGWLPLLNFHFMENEDAALPESVLADLRADLTGADEKETNSFARQSVVSQINYLYQSAKLYDDARTLLLAELDRSESPYYFMSSLSSIAENQEKTEEALEWRRRAYETSKGAATRFQWGASYVRAIVRLTPDNHDLIVNTSMNLFDDLQGEQEVFAGRNFRILRSLNKQLAEWQDDQLQDALIETFHTRIQAMCEKQTAATLELENCQSLLSS